MVSELKRGLCPRCLVIKKGREKENTLRLRDQDNNNIATDYLRNVVKKRDLSVPYLTEHAISVNRKFGGPDGWADKMYKLYIEAKPGSMVQLLVLRAVVEINRLAKEQEVPMPELGDMEPDEVAAEVGELLGTFNVIEEQETLQLESPLTLDEIKAPVPLCVIQDYVKADCLAVDVLPESVSEQLSEIVDTAHAKMYEFYESFTF